MIYTFTSFFTNPTPAEISLLIIGGAFLVHQIVVLYRKSVDKYFWHELAFILILGFFFTTNEIKTAVADVTQFYAGSDSRTVYEMLGGNMVVLSNAFEAALISLVISLIGLPIHAASLKIK